MFFFKNIFVWGVDIDNFGTSDLLNNQTTEVLNLDLGLSTTNEKSNDFMIQDTLGLFSKESPAKKIDLSSFAPTKIEAKKIPLQIENAQASRPRR